MNNIAHNEQKERATFEFHFHGPVGQNIAQVEHMEVRFDKDMHMHIANVDEMQGINTCTDTTESGCTAEKDGTVDNENQTKQSDDRLCVVLNSKQTDVLRRAEEADIIVYLPHRKGYRAADSASQALVSYLCGRLFCGDRTRNGCWEKGGKLNDALYCKQLFGFDVGNMRRVLTSRGAAHPPIGYQRVDELF